MTKHVRLAEGASVPQRYHDSVDERLAEIEKPAVSGGFPE